MRSRSHVAVAVGGLVLTVLLPRLLVFPAVSLGPDEVAYGLIGRELWAGNWPYTTAFDHKPVALFLPYALAVGLVGETMTALRVLSLVVAVVGYVLVVVVARRMRVSLAAASAAACLYSLMTLGNQGSAALSENLVNLYLLGMVLMILLPRGIPASLGLGALMGFAVHSNYVVGPLCAVLGLYFLWRERRQPWRWVAAAAGLATMSVLVLLPVHLWSDLLDYVDLQVQFLTSYGASPERPSITILRWGRFLAPLVPLLAVSAVLAAVLPTTRTVAAARWVALLAVALVTISLNEYFFGHYLMLAAVPVTLLLVTQVRMLPAGRGLVLGIALGAAAWLLVLPMSVMLADGYRSIRDQGSLAPDQTTTQIRVATAVSEIAEPGDVIYSRNVHYYFLTKAELPTRFFFPSHHLADGITAARGTTRDEEMRQIVSKRPVAVVIDHMNPVPAAKDQVLAQYLEQECAEPRVVSRTRVYDCR